MTNAIEISGYQLAAPPETLLAPELLAPETAADDAMAGLAEAVDAIYAEAGLEESLDRKVGMKNYGSGDDNLYMKD